MQLDPINPALKAPEMKRLKLEYDCPLSNFAFNINLRRYSAVDRVAFGKALAANGRGLQLVHFSAQLEPFLTLKHTLSTPITPYHPLKTPETTPSCTPCPTESAYVEPKSERV